ncbi:hypothetical protein ACFL1E_00785 [Candidatus Omnitrophota bacterium]
MKIFRKLIKAKAKHKKNLKDLATNSRVAARVAIENYINENLYNSSKYQNPKKLNRFEFQCHSQNGEDGIIAEIFRRIGVTNQFFVEFGASTNGLENNTTYLLLKGWKGGAWIEGNPKDVERIKRKYRTFVNNKKLSVRCAFVTAENIEGLFKELDIPKEFDLLSVDIDGNDYWVWKAITHYRPRVVVIEYNPSFDSDLKWVMKYNPQHVWNGTIYYGASLKSLEILGAQKGYKLIGCNFTGANAFFVREDLVKDKFLEPFTSENHYEPPRYYLLRTVGHERDFGDFESI